MDELLDASNTNIQRTQMDGENGLKVTSISNGKSIFLPAAGYAGWRTGEDAGREGYYWSRSLDTEDNWQAYYMVFAYYGEEHIYEGDRRSGRTIRPVKTKTSGSTDNHEWVDLDLPSGTLWATMDVGADSPEDKGYHFAWGEIVTKDKTTPSQNYSWANYKWCKGSKNTITKYCPNSSYGYNGFTDDLTELLPEDDAATANWGGKWQMPSRDQCEELMNTANTTTEWTTQGGVSGLKVTSKTNGNSIFLPAVGSKSAGYVGEAGVKGQYWSRMLYTNFSDYGFSMLVSASSFSMTGISRSDGHAVRPVKK
jgi:hypothetical protein